MAHKFISSHPDQQNLIPTNLADLVPQNHPVHFYIKVVRKMNICVDKFKVCQSESDKQTYNPIMMTRLYLYCATHGMETCVKIYEGTYDWIPVRYLSRDLHPDYHTIAAFVKDNQQVISKIFIEFLIMVTLTGLDYLGDVSLDLVPIRKICKKYRNDNLKLYDELTTYFEGVVDKLISNINPPNEIEIYESNAKAVGAFLKKYNLN